MGAGCVISTGSHGAAPGPHLALLLCAGPSLPASGQAWEGMAGGREKALQRKILGGLEISSLFAGGSTGKAQ